MTLRFGSSVTSERFAWQREGLRPKLLSNPGHRFRRLIQMPKSVSIQKTEFGPQTPKPKLRTPNGERRTANDDRGPELTPRNPATDAERQTPNAEPRTSNPKLRTPNLKRPTSSCRAFLLCHAVASGRLPSSRKHSLLFHSTKP
jgi:hypothetical protein